MATIYVTGATGVLGREGVRLLVDQGHTVRALARNAERKAHVEATGAEAIVGDIYDVDAMTEAMSGADALLHLATRIPPIEKARKQSEWLENTKLRAVGTKVLVDAALAAGVGRVVAESITFVYCDGGSEWLDEGSPIDPGVGLQSVVTLEEEVARFAAQGSGTGISLRFGGFYGADARGTDEFLKAGRLHVAPVLGGPDGYVSSIHTSDAASAVVAALGAPSGVYNVVDDVPLTRRDYVDAFAKAFGFRRLRFVPTPIVKVVGGATVQPLLRSQRVSNARMRATGWTPKFSNAIDGWAAVAATRKETLHA